MRTPFLGQAYTSRSKNLADQRLINLYPEVVESKSGKDVGAFYMAPGLDLLLTLGIGPIRQVYTFSNGSQLYVVSGFQVFSVTPSLSATLIGTIATGTGLVSFIDNGVQVALFDGLNGYLISAGVLSMISLPASNPSSATIQDGFGLVNAAGTNQFYQSNLDDLSTWNALNFSSADGSPDNIVALWDIHREVWVFKQSNIEIWVDAGLSGFSFQRLDGVFIQHGLAASASVAKVDESLIWLSTNREGQGIVVKSNGYAPVRVSTSAIEREIQGYATMADAIGYTYQQEGHNFYVLNFPTGNATWVFDVRTGAWHQRAAFANGAFSRHWAACHTLFNGLSVVGDYRNGNIYSFNLDTLTDNGTQRKWLRSWRALPKPSPDPVRFDSLSIDMETGAKQVPSGTNPQLVLRHSDDGGHTWSSERFAAAGPIGQTALRVKFNRLGSTRYATGLDRIFELSSTDQFKVALIGAELE